MYIKKQEAILLRLGYPKKVCTKNVRNFVSIKEIQVKSRLLLEEGIKVPTSREGRNAVLEHA